MIKKIINADDFGISPGVNQAITEAYKDGILNSTSIMINLKYVDNALKLAQSMPNLNIGLHVNLTNEYALSPKEDVSLLVDENGKFKNGFVNLLLLSLRHPKELKKQIETEIRAQIQKAITLGIKLSHIDSHRHIHMIPSIFDVVKKLANEYKIPRIRVVNENIFNTLKYNKDTSFLFDGGLIKYFILRTLSFYNNYKTDTYFYSILYTCKLKRERFRKLKIPTKYKAIEIGIHPGHPDIDKNYIKDVFDNNILNPYREIEYQTLMDKSVINEILDNAN